ncbi:Hypothetical protein PHPALM_125 [Phytophthora palmivora]|uniref:Uncharacterized protein n=1 Tax=Phytophthora palmivora TaxID=4796 RepID=A0A2P4YVS1_9STRA|nr:Hypothetical protein PHPALM_125 [Phytophthora palmivora]
MAHVATRCGNIRFSPFGCVPKKDADPRVEARLIHYLSSPPLCRPKVNYRMYNFAPFILLQHLLRIYIGNTQISQKIKGDVQSPFRHIMVGFQISRWFAGSKQENNVAVLDLVLPFGWTGSPEYYRTCALHPARRIHIRVDFDFAEREMIKQCKLEPQSHKNNFTINVCEQLTAVLILLSWGHEWAQSVVPTLPTSDVGSTTNILFPGVTRCPVGTLCRKNSIESSAHAKLSSV